MPSQYARTLRQVINDTLRLCNDYRGDGKDGRTWAWTEARTTAQDVLLEMVRRTGLLKDDRVIFLESDKQIYDLPPECIRILRIGIHVVTGQVILPTSISERDYAGLARSSEGEPVQFYRDHTLAPNQIGFIPTPTQDGSSFVRDSDHGLLRRIVDEEGNELPYDANYALRRVTGVPFARRGKGNIIREMISLYGNIQIAYVRAPEKWEKPDTYPDSDIPVYVHKDLKYGNAARLLRGSKKNIHKLKQVRFQNKWEGIIGDIQRYCEHQGSNTDAKPL